MADTDVLIPICDAVTSELNSQQWLQKFTAKRQNVIRHKREDMATLHVSVTGKTIKRSPAARDRVMLDVDVYIGVEKGLKGDTNEESDPLISLCDQIAEYFQNGRRLAALPTVSCTESKYGDSADTPWMNLKAQDELLQFTGVIVVSIVAMQMTGS